MPKVEIGRTRVHPLLNFAGWAQAKFRLACHVTKPAQPSLDLVLSCDARIPLNLNYATRQPPVSHTNTQPHLSHTNTPTHQPHLSHTNHTPTFESPRSKYPSLVSVDQASWPSSGVDYLRYREFVNPPKYAITRILHTALPWHPKLAVEVSASLVGITPIYMPSSIRGASAYKFAMQTSKHARLDVRTLKLQSKYEQKNPTLNLKKK